MRELLFHPAVRPRNKGTGRTMTAAGVAALERAASFPAHVLRTLDDIEAMLELDRLFLDAHPAASACFRQVAGIKRRALEQARHAIQLYLRRDPAA
jgi:hypothetical protein